MSESSPISRPADVAGKLTGVRVVSVTPNSLKSDSRTLKQAASLARAGAKSVVIEGFDSQRDFSKVNISVESLAPAPAAEKDLHHNNDATSRSSGSRIKSAIRSLVPTPLIDARQFIQVLIALFRQQWLPLYRMLPSADVYILHSMNFWPAIWLKSRITGVKYIYDAHDFYREMNRTTNVDRFTRKWMLPMYAWLDRMAVRHAFSMMTVSEGVAALYSNADGIVPHLLRNCHDLRSDSTPKETLRDVVGITPDQFLIVVIGNAKPGSSIGKLIDVIARSDESIHIAFVGKDFDPEKKIARSPRMRGRLHFVDAVPADEIVPFIASADCAMIVYFAETENYEMALPNRFFQSVAASLPLIYPRLHEMHKLAASIPCGISFQPDDANEMSESINAVFHDFELRERLKRQANVARDTFTWEAEEPGFVDVLRKALPVNNGSIK